MKNDQSMQPAESIQDMMVYEEARSVFGEAGARERLQIFYDQLATDLSEAGQNMPDLTVLRSVAHRTAGRAGLFGFAALADASACLDEAAQTNTGVEPAFDHWLKQAAHVVEVQAPAHEPAASNP